MIEAHDLTKRYGGTLAVDGLTFTVRPGIVTGFLGPNGAGKPNLGKRHLFSRFPRRPRHQQR
jgi:ABC-type multidrug transport system ATPase subunit